ncbi:hypothetical protein [Embleya sp. NPDC059237]|uniref:hypothetical protein n=1 Tax=Embleya sp. NPDC059237 TaxID=3346784 RepID=UPI00368D8332
MALNGVLADVVAAALVAERERGVGWERLEKVGSPRHSPRHDGSRAVLAWSSEGRRVDGCGRELAAALDEWFSATGGGPTAVSGELDVTRFPGSDAYENASRRPGDLLRPRAREARETERNAWAALTAIEFAEGDSGVDHPTNVAVVEALEVLADVHEELAEAEPVLAEDHRANADFMRNSAIRLRRDGPMG